MSLLDELMKRAAQAKQYAGQIPASFMDLVQNSVTPEQAARQSAVSKSLKARGGLSGAIETVRSFDPLDNRNYNYRPAIADVPAAIGGLISGLIGKPAPEGSIRDEAMKSVNVAQDRTNEALGIEDPKDLAQTLLRVLPAGMVGGTPKAALNVAKAATKVGRLAQDAGKIGIEAILPLRQTGLKAALATQGAATSILSEGLEALDPSDEYTGIADLLSQQQVDEFGDSAAQPIVDEFGDMPTRVTDEFGGPVKVPSADDIEADSLMKGVVGAAVVVSAGLGLSVARRGLKKINNPVPSGELVGSRVVQPRGGTSEKLQGAVAQHDQPARNAATEFLTLDEADRFKFNSDRIIPQALGAKIKSAIGTGQFPGTTVRVQPLAPLYEAISKDLDQTEYKMLADGLLAKSALDDINNSPTGVQASFTDKTPAELQALAALVDNDPKLSKYADLIREQYKGLLDYRKEMGFLDGNMYQEFRNKRPNYVHLSRDVTREGGPEGPSGLGGSKLDEMFTRGEEASSGVQAGATTDPIAELQNRYAQTIRAAELNQHKLQFFDDLTRSRAIHETVPTNDGSIEKFITELPDAPKTLDGVHAVYDGGRVRYFKIGDPALDRTLRYAPKATAGVFGTMRQVAQFFTTGAGNPLSMFGATVSPVYDTLSGMVLRPAGTDLGVINEVLNRVGSPFTLGGLDPTVLASAPIGAVRRAFDGLTEGLANSLSDQLIRDHGAVLDVLGPQKTTALRDMLKSKYQSSIRSMLEQEGVSSSQQWGADSGRGLPIGLHEMAPNYYADLSRRATAEALKGDYKFHEGVLAQGKNAFAQAKASKIARMYGAVLQNMQEGFRYQFAATNMPKVKSMRDMNELMSQTRRIASDTGQFGGSDAWNKVADSAMYANVGMQALSEWARKFAQQPGTTITNLTTTIAMLAALRYGAMYSDPEIAKEVRSRTDAQNTAKIITPGGIELPVEPMMRMATGPLFAVLDNMIINPDGTMDPNFGSAIFQYFDDDDVQERGGQAAWDAFKAGGSAALPVTPNSFPLLNASAASLGVDPGLTRVTGEPVQIRPQQTDPLGGTGKTANSMMDAYWGKVLESLTGSSITNLVDIADQWQRAAFSQNRDGSRGVSPAGAVKVALSSAVDSASKTSGPAQSMLFKDYEKVQSIADTDFKLYQGKKEGMDKATQIMRAMKTSGGPDLDAYVTGTDPRYAMVRPIDLVPPDYVNTPLAPIAAITAQYSKEIKKIENLVSSMTKQMNDVRSQVGSTIEQRNQQLNEINKERRYYYGRMLQLQRQAEDAIGEQIGDENFSYQNFEADRYLPKPMQQSTGPAPQ